eukprot:1159269-Pelagomonas_calceolata.AAC.5
MKLAQCLQALASSSKMLCITPPPLLQVQDNKAAVEVVEQQDWLSLPQHLMHSPCDCTGSNCPSTLPGSEQQELCELAVRSVQVSSHWVSPVALAGRGTVPNELSAARVVCGCCAQRAGELTLGFPSGTGWLGELRRMRGMQQELCVLAVRKHAGESLVLLILSKAIE